MAPPRRRYSIAARLLVQRSDDRTKLIDVVREVVARRLQFTAKMI